MGIKLGEESERNLEKRLFDANQATILRAILESFIHELNNPLHILGGRIELALEALDWKKVSPDSIREHLTAAHDAVELLKSRVSYISGFVSTAPKEKKTYNLHDILDELMQHSGILDYHMSRQGVTITRDYFPEVLAFSCYHDDVRAVFLNILVNAIEAMESRKNKQITLRTSVEDGNYRIDFSDTGPGIPSDNLAKIFEASVTTKGKGRGNGLYLCNEIVKAYGGRIEVKIEFGKGSTFSVYLPAER